MRELAAALLARHVADRDYALATVISVRGSAPCAPGTSMAVDTTGAVVGSLSGGCVEAAVHELCVEVLATGVPVRETFGYSDSDAIAVGLTCGGVLEVFVHRVDAAARPAIEAVLTAAGPVALVRDLRTGAAGALVEADEPAASTADVGQAAAETARPVGDSDWLGAAFSPRVRAEVRDMLAAGCIGIRRIGCGADESELFVVSYRPPPRLLVFGAGNFSAALVRMGKYLGYHVTVCDARPVFTTRDRFPEADEVVVEWPHRYLESTVVDARTVICVLAHDAKFEVPLLERALRLSVAFVGAMGSRRTCADRAARLRAAGLTERELSRLHAPIGLDLGARSPEETAVAIAAEIVAARTGSTAQPLTTTPGPVHGGGIAVSAG
ncbi:XdhC family protein [Nocardia stercoris]|uniref:XdhC/CoxI family protein n=1 Tax=Nocardia stercoris TaxID=2483361 RepID=A0A3M2KWT6_9NOCA|nr:XdhC/CoxI family protein [Nocardia stercoris]RMI29494.1 XdhC/CoxI family protein [Nocardia stercoris]